MLLPYEEHKEQYPYRVDKKVRSAFSMGDQPNTLFGSWSGYFHQQDPTTYPADRDNVLLAPSQNCFIPFRDKIVPRKGSDLLGIAATEDWGCVGRMKKYGTMSGIELELRVTKSDDANLKDIIEAWCPDFIAGVRQSTYSWKQITLKTNPLQAGAHRYYFQQWFDTDLDPSQALNLSRAIWVNGNKEIYSWTGGIAPIVSIVPNVSITTVSGVNWESQGFVDPAFDSTLAGKITINGVAYTVSGGWETDTLLIANTTGISVNDVAFSEIQVNQTPINISATITHGVVTPGPFATAFKNGEMIIGGTSGAIAFVTLDGSSPGPMLLYGVQLGPNSVNLAHAFTVGETITGISSQVTTVVGSYTQTSYNQLAFDVCSNNNGYMYYGSWVAMKVYQSNQFNKPPTQFITNVVAVQNDLVLGMSDYTGTSQQVYKITIDSVTPAISPINTQSFIAGTPYSLDDATYNTIGYTGGAGVENKYLVTVVANYTLHAPGSGYNFIPGETVIASVLGVSTGATAMYFAEAVATQSGTFSFHGVRVLTGQFKIGDTVTGLSSGEIITLDDVFFDDWIQFFKNGVAQNISYSIWNQITFPLQDIALTATLTDGLTITFTNYFGHGIGDSWLLDIKKGVPASPDTFKWQVNGATPVQTLVPITGAVQQLSNGITISFTSTTGHAVNDFWEITVTQGVGGNTPTDFNQQAFANFYYTLPERIPGEGYIFPLNANFWTMGPQEGDLYVCDNYGAWSYISTITTLATTGTVETISITPLKQTSSSKPIYPYMMGYLDNDIIFVTTEHTLDLIGRKQLIQLPRISSLSHPVQLDFDAVSFEEGSMDYWNNMLWINSPKEGVMFCYDNHEENHYWQPPQIIPENGILSVINQNGADVLISHSHIKNQSYTLFTGINGDNGLPYTVRAVSPYFSRGARWQNKSANKTFSEGYIEGKPPMVQTLYKEINGCKGIIPHDIKAIPCIAPSNAPLGMGHFGSHPHGSGSSNPGNYWKESYPYKDTQNYYFAAIEMSCTTLNHSYEWLSFGINDIIANRGNIDSLNQELISPS